MTRSMLWLLPTAFFPQFRLFHQTLFQVHLPRQPDHWKLKHGCSAEIVAVPKDTAMLQLTSATWMLSPRDVPQTVEHIDNTVGSAQFLPSIAKLLFRDYRHGQHNSILIALYHGGDSLCLRKLSGHETPSPEMSLLLTHYTIAGEQRTFLSTMANTRVKTLRLLLSSL